VASRSARHHGSPARIRRLLVAPFLILLTMSGCSGRSGGDPLPPLPDVDTTGMQDVVVAQLDRAAAQLRSMPRDASANGRFGMLLLAYEMDRPGLALLERARRLDAEDDRWPYYAAYAQHRLGDAEGAVANYRLARALAPDDMDVRIALATARLAAGEPAAAQAELATLDPGPAKRADLRYAEARAHLAQGEANEAVPLLMSLLADIGDTGPVHYALADALRRSGDREGAARHFKLAQEYEARRIPVEDARLWALESLQVSDQSYLRRGNRAFASGKINEAVGLFERAAAANPANADAHANLVAAYWQLRQPRPAQNHYREAVTLDPDHCEAHFNYGVMRFQQRQPGDALFYLLRAADCDPRHVDARVYLGYAQLLTENTESALGTLAAALELAPEHPLGNYLLGRELAARGELPQAMVLLERSAAADDASKALFLRELALVYGRLNRVADAEQARQAARELAAAQGNRQLLELLDDDDEP
jgi:tetratricopeptide (TPR) repeat protein